MGRVTAVVERGDDEVPGSGDIVIQHVAHRLGGIDSELNGDSGISHPVSFWVGAASPKFPPLREV